MKYIFSFYGFQLLKIAQKYGEIKKFDLLFHRTGPQAGKSRGYGFVTYKNESDAQNALNQLNGMWLVSKNISVKWAHPGEKVRANRIILFFFFCCSELNIYLLHHV